MPAGSPDLPQAGTSMQCDVLIVGAGLVGAALAAALGPSGLKTILLDAERHTEPAFEGWDSRVYAISPGSKAFLAACGAWQRIPADRVAPVESMRVVGDEPTAGIVFDAYDCGIPELCCIVESREIQRALAAVNAQADGPTCLYGESPQTLSLDEESALVETGAGRTIETRLVVGADGMRSWVREAAGIEHELRAYGQQGVVANFATELPHASAARQWFLSGSVLALLPLPGNRVSLVWSTADAHAERLLAAAPEDFTREVAAACGYALGAMQLITPPRGFALHLMRVAQSVRPRIALIGDAAHVVHPLAGQGLNLGFQDARELASVLAQRGPQDDCGDYRLLRRYERARREPVMLMEWTTDGLQRLFATRGRGLAWLRNNGLKWTNGILPLKNLLIEHALA